MFVSPHIICVYMLSVTNKLKTTTRRMMGSKNPKIQSTPNGLKYSVKISIATLHSNVKKLIIFCDCVQH